VPLAIRRGTDGLNITSAARISVNGDGPIIYSVVCGVSVVIRRPQPCAAGFIGSAGNAQNGNSGVGIRQPIPKITNQSPFNLPLELL
jgi:hypothetical protein